MSITRPAHAAGKQNPRSFSAETSEDEQAQSEHNVPLIFQIESPRGGHNCRNWHQANGFKFKVKGERMAAIYRRTLNLQPATFHYPLVAEASQGRSLCLSG